VSAPQTDRARPAEFFRERFLEIRRAVGEVIVGHDDVVLGVITALVSGGHVLIEGPPGTGKTLLAKTIAHLTGLTFARVQFTPDLLPSDILGGAVLRRGLDGVEETAFRPGPIFANLVLADEVNRASPRTQAALLEAMEERQVTAMGETHPLPSPSVVIATQNPLDRGTYPVPESQLDRFMLRLAMPRPATEQLVEILERQPARRGAKVDAVFDAEALRELAELARAVEAAPEILQAVADIVAATDPQSATAPELVRSAVRGGASPRGALALLQGARVRAIAVGRHHVAFEDVRAVAPAALFHRLLLDWTRDDADTRAAAVAAAVDAALPE